MKLLITQGSLIREVQENFNLWFPYLKLEFYSVNAYPKSSSRKAMLQNTVSVKDAGLDRTTILEVTDSMTVGKLQDNFLMHCGLTVQVSRKSGTLWLETTMTDKWTLKQQNNHGEDLCNPGVKSIISKDRYLDEN